MLPGSSALSEFRTSLSKVLTLWHFVKVKQRYLSHLYMIWPIYLGMCIASPFQVCLQPVSPSMNSKRTGNPMRLNLTLMPLTLSLKAKSEQTTV